MDIQVFNAMKEEFKQEIDSENSTLEEIQDNSGEWIDGYLPVYNNQIIKEWQEMPSDYDDRGAYELGASDNTGIIQRMSLDLYLYYSDIFNAVIEELQEELENA